MEFSIKQVLLDEILEDIANDVHEFSESWGPAAELSTLALDSVPEGERPALAAQHLLQGLHVQALQTVAKTLYVLAKKEN